MNWIPSHHQGPGVGLGCSLSISLRVGYHIVSKMQALLRAAEPIVQNIDFEGLNRWLRR